MVTYVVDGPDGVTVAVVAAGPVPHVLTAATENVAATPPASPPSVALVADPLVATDCPLLGPVAARTTYPVTVLPFPLAAPHDTVASFAPPAADAADGGPGAAQELTTAGRATATPISGASATIAQAATAAQHDLAIRPGTNRRPQ